MTCHYSNSRVPGGFAAYVSYTTHTNTTQLTLHTHRIHNQQTCKGFLAQRLMAGSEPLIQEGDLHIMKLTIGARMEDKMVQKKSLHERGKEPALLEKGKMGTSFIRASKDIF